MKVIPETRLIYFIDKTVVIELLILDFIYLSFNLKLVLTTVEHISGNASLCNKMHIYIYIYIFLI